MLKLFGSRPPELIPEQLAADLLEVRERGEFLLWATVAVLACVKELPFDSSESHAATFAGEIDKTARQLQAAKSAAEMKKQFAGKPERILKFLQQEQAYLDARAAEYQAIIDMLRRNLTTLFDGNQSYTDALQDHHQRLVGLTRIDDIRHIREELRSEVDTVRTQIATKKASDIRQLETLSREMDSLRTKLQQVTAVAKTDALTGAYNRLAFDMGLQHMLDRFASAGDRFAVLICDLDDFKRINDTYGHLTGDRVLKSFIAECQRYFREQDFIARYGGEEFGIILPGYSCHDAHPHADRFCRQLANTRFHLDEGAPNSTLIYTTSIGISEPHKGDTPDTLLARADKALYLAKHQGKNRAQTEEDVRRCGR